MLVRASHMSLLLEEMINACLAFHEKYGATTNNVCVYPCLYL